MFLSELCVGEYRVNENRIKHMCSYKVLNFSFISSQKAAYSVCGEYPLVILERYFYLCEGI